MFREHGSRLSALDWELVEQACAEVAANRRQCSADDAGETDSDCVIIEQSTSTSAAKSTRANDLELNSDSDSDSVVFLDSPPVIPKVMPSEVTSPTAGRKFGDMGLAIGTTFKNRYECYQSGMHPHHVWGICGTKEEGAWSICMSGNYEDDLDLGDVIYYTGAGGRQYKGFHSQFSPQQYDQSLQNRSNKRLVQSFLTGNPVRVIRGSGDYSSYAPAKGYRYDGLYTVENVEETAGKQGHQICRYTLVRIKGQVPIPRATGNTN